MIDYLNAKYLIPVAVTAVILLIGGGFFYFQIQKNHAAKNNPAVGSQDEVKRMVGEVGKLVDLPVGETPTVATVADITKLQGQAFFKNAKNGDKVLIYTNAKKAILYDPIGKKVIDIAPINTATPSATNSAQQVATSSASPKSTTR